MKRYLILISTLLFMFGCFKAIKKTEVYPEKPYIEINYSFNKEIYPKFLGFVKTCLPQIAIWIKEKDTTYVKTIYATDMGARDTWYFANSRPSSIPVWYGIRSREPQLDVDGISGATPSGETHSVFWNIPKELLNKKIEIFIEANVAYDYNDHYVDDENGIYSDVNGQPSVIWKSELVLRDNLDSSGVPEIVGHGQVLCKDSLIYENLETITSAKNLFNYIKINYIANSF